MYSLLLVCCLVSAVTAVIPFVSESFYFQGRATISSTTSGTTDYSVYNVAVDRDRSLLVIETETETGGISGFRLESNTANLLIESTGDTCTGTTYEEDTDNPFSISRDPWAFLSNSLTFDIDETFTLVEGSTRSRAVFNTDLIPTEYEFTTTSSQTVVIVEIDRFYNETPPFYLFDLPSACSAVTCAPCYTGTQPPPTTTPASSAGRLRNLVTFLIVSGMLILFFV